MSPNPSAGVRLEVALLDDQAASASPARSAGEAGEGSRLTVLVVAADADVRLHVRECLRDCADMRVLEAPSVTVALTLEAQAAPRLMIVDVAQSDVLIALPHARAVVLVDDDPREERPADARVRFVARPFTADQLLTEVNLVRRQ